jgi:hypothetical protein
VRRKRATTFKDASPTALGRSYLSAGLASSSTAAQSSTSLASVASAFIAGLVASPYIPGDPEGPRPICDQQQFFDATSYGYLISRKDVGEGEKFLQAVAQKHLGVFCFIPSFLY